MPWRIDPDGRCVIGSVDDTFQLWRPQTDEWSSIELAGGETPDGLVLFDSCERAWYVHGENVGWIDLGTGDVHELAALDGNLSGPSVTIAPNEDRLVWIDGGGVHGADLSTGSVDLSLPCRYARLRAFPGGPSPGRGHDGRGLGGLWSGDQRGSGRGLGRAVEVSVKGPGV